MNYYFFKQYFIFYCITFITVNVMNYYFFKQYFDSPIKPEKVNIKNKTFNNTLWTLCKLIQNNLLIKSGWFFS